MRTTAPVVLYKKSLNLMDSHNSNIPPQKKKNGRAFKKETNLVIPEITLRFSIALVSW